VNGVPQTGQGVVVSLSLRHGRVGWRLAAGDDDDDDDVVSLSLRGGRIGGFPVVGCAARGGLDDLLGWVEVEGGEQVTLGFGQFGALPERAGRSGEGDQVQPVEVRADRRPGVPGGGLGDAHE